MPSVVAERPGSYLVELWRKDLPLPFVSIRVESGDGSSRSLFVPALPHATYLLQTTAKDMRILYDPEEVARVDIKPVRALARTFHLRRKSDRRFTMSVADGIELTPLLGAEGRQGKELRKALRLITNWGFGISSLNLQTTPGLLKPCPESEEREDRSPATEPGPARFAVVLHLHYRDLWPEFEAGLRRLRQPFHLIVTTTKADAPFEARVRVAFPKAEIHVLENRGRDVGPFLQLLHDGRLNGYPFICKLHGKRSGISGPRALFGEVWRRTNIADLIGSSEQIEKILRRFEAIPQIGMIGSPRFRLPNEFVQHRAAWAENKSLTFDLATRIGLAPEDFRLDFFAGTMFWIRQETLAPLRALDLTLDDFTEENGALDGELQHALERLFGAVPQSIGMLLDSAPAMLGGISIRRNKKKS